MNFDYGLLRDGYRIWSTTLRINGKHITVHKILANPLLDFQFLCTEWVSASNNEEGKVCGGQKIVPSTHLNFPPHFKAYESWRVPW